MICLKFDFSLHQRNTVRNTPNDGIKPNRYDGVK